MSRLHIFALVLLFAFGSVGVGQAAQPGQQPPPAQVPASTAQSPSMEPAGKAEPGRERAKSTPPLRQEHVVYVPFEKLRDVLKDDESSIVLPYAQFLEMWNRLIQPERPAMKPPVNGLITRADYVGSVKGDLARLEATLDVKVLTDGWAQLPVRFGDAAIGSAKAEDDDVLLRGVGQGQYELLVHGKGRHQIKLSLVVGVKSETEGRSFVVQCPAVGVSNLELEVPEKDLAVQVTPRRTSQTRSDGKGGTHVRAVLGSTDQFTVSWQPKSGSTDQAAGLANVTDTISVDVGEGVVHTHAVFDYRILRGSLAELVVEVPTDRRLLDVQAPGLRDWQSEKVEDRQRVRVRLHAPATEAVRLELRTEAPIAEKAFDVGQVRAIGVARESGILVVRGAEDVGLQHVLRESLTRIDAGDVPESLRKPGSTFYKFFTPDHKLSVVASQRQPRVVVDSHISIVLDKSRLTTRGEFHYQVSRSGVFSLAFRLPEGFQVDDIQTQSMERFEVGSDDAGRTLTVYFTKKLLGDFTVSVTAGRRRDVSAGELPLPLLEPLRATREQGLVAVIAPASLEVKTEAARLEAARAATPAELAAKGFVPKVPDGSTLAAAFSFVTRPVSIVQTITERPRHTVVNVGTVANVKEDIVQVSTTLSYQVQFAGTDTFRIAVPAGVSDRLQIEGDGVRERRKSEKAGEDGMTEWTVLLHSEALGQRVLRATYDRRISVPDEGTSVELRPIVALDADRGTGEISIQKDRALSIEAVATGLEEIDPRELSQPIGTTHPYLTYRYYQHPAQLTLNVSKHELQGVVKTVVRRAYVEAVVTEDGPVTMRARYDLKSSERQRLAVTLRQPRILGISVAGQTVAPEKAPAAPGSGPEDKTYFINVARAADSDEPFQIQIVFETPLPEEELTVNDLLHLSLPRFDEGVKFQKLYVRAWVPTSYRLVGTPEGFASHIGVGPWDSRKITHAADNPDSWFKQDALSFDFQVGGTSYLFSSLTGPTELSVAYWHIPTMTMIASLLILALGAVLVPFSLDTKVFAILALVFLALFVGLFTPSIVNSWLLSARLGIAGVVALWLVVWLLFVRRHGHPMLSAAVQGGEVPVASAASADESSGAAAKSPFAPEPSPDREQAIDAEAVDEGASGPDTPAADRSEDATDKKEGGSDDK